jgi:hypothetical protein
MLLNDIKIILMTQHNLMRLYSFGLQNEFKNNEGIKYTTNHGIHRDSQT